MLNHVYTKQAQYDETFCRIFSWKSINNFSVQAMKYNLSMSWNHYRFVTFICFSTLTCNINWNLNPDTICQSSCHLVTKNWRTVTKTVISSYEICWTALNAGLAFLIDYGGEPGFIWFQSDNRTNITSAMLQSWRLGCVIPSKY